VLGDSARRQQEQRQQHLTDAAAGQNKGAEFPPGQGRGGGRGRGRQPIEGMSMTSAVTADDEA